MKIGVITIEKVNNYGAELQATATIKVLQGMGYEGSPDKPGGLSI